MSNSGNEDAIMLYGFGNDCRDIYNLNIGQTPSLIFTYYDASDIYHEYPISGMTTVLLSSNLNTGVEGYYYRNYRATNGATYDLTFRIVFKVGNPVNHPTIPQEHIHYNYSTNWEDQLLSYGEIEYINGVPQAEAIQQQFTYDLQGNPIIITNFRYAETIYEYAVLSWSGRELTQIDLYNALDINEYRIEYTYNDQGYRTNKTVSYNNGSSWQAITIIDYELIGSQVIYENGQEYNTVTNEWFNYDIIYTYDVNGTIIGFSYSDDDHTSADYFYLRNQQGDITHILDANGTAVIKYKYDAYGNITDTIIVSGYNYIGNHNSYTYKGYRYDSEIKMYYLNSRYYNPETGRFINADGMLGQLGDIQSTNMYAYCANNPVMYTDSTGESWESFWNEVGEWFSNTFGIETSLETSVTNYFFFAEVEGGAGKTTKSGKPVNITFGIPREIWKIWEYSFGIDVNSNGKGIGFYFGGETGISFTNGNQTYDFSLNALGRMGFKSSTYDDSGNYSYSKFNINFPEILITIAILYYAPSYLPLIFSPVA